MLLTDSLKQQSNFSDSERIIANYILNNPQKIAEMNIRELASSTFCSTATISRFCKKIGVDNFSRFKLQLASELSSSGNTRRIEYNFPFLPSDTITDIKQTIKSLSLQTINDSDSFIDVELVYTAAKLIDAARQIDIYADGNSLVSAIDLHNKLLWIDKNSNLELIRGLQRLKASAAPSDSLAIIFSYYGTSEKSIHIVKTLKEKNTPYLLITGPKLNPLCIHARLTIHVPPVEESLYKIGPMSSRIAMTFVNDLLYSLLFSLHYEKNKSTLLRPSFPKP